MVGEGDRPLPEVVLAVHSSGCLPGGLHRRKEKGNEGAEDGDHDEQLDERESAAKEAFRARWTIPPEAQLGAVSKGIHGKINPQFDIETQSR